MDRCPRIRAVLPVDASVRSSCTIHAARTLPDTVCLAALTMEKRLRRFDPDRRPCGVDRPVALLERTLIVLVSDHGEGLGEHETKTSTAFSPTTRHYTCRGSCGCLCSSSPVWCSSSLWASSMSLRPSSTLSTRRFTERGRTTPSAEPQSAHRGRGDVRTPRRSTHACTLAGANYSAFATTDSSSFGAEDSNSTTTAGTLPSPRILPRVSRMSRQGSIRF